MFLFRAEVSLSGHSLVLSCRLFSLPSICKFILSYFFFCGGGVGSGTILGGRASARGTVGYWIDPSWWTHQLFLHIWCNISMG